MAYFELSKRNSKGGKRKIKMSLLEIHQDEKATNKNGLHWREQYILNNLDSIQEMPICCEFLDEDKSIPYGHGFTEIDSKENQPLFENSECVGCISKAYPTNVEIDGINKRILCGEGYIYEQRYPKFVEWLSEHLKKGKVLSSIEIMGKPENNNMIIYENNDTNSDYRIPMVFDFSATAILSIEAADDSAVILQMNSLDKTKNTDISKQNTTNESEEQIMDEKMLSQFVDSIKNTITETNSKNAEFEAQVSELNTKLSEKETEVTELNGKVVSETERADKAEKTIEELNEKVASLEAELMACKQDKKRGELNSAIADFTDDEKAFAQAEIDAFNADPMAVEINSIVDKIYAEIGKKATSDAKAQKASEINSKANETVDIYGDICEANSTSNDEMSIY